MTVKEMHEFIKTCKRGDEVDITLRVLVTDSYIDENYDAYGDMGEDNCMSAVEVYSTCFYRSLYADAHYGKEHEFVDIKKVEKDADNDIR